MILYILARVSNKLLYINISCIIQVTYIMQNIFIFPNLNRLYNYNFLFLLFLISDPDHEKLSPLTWLTLWSVMLKLNNFTHNIFYTVHYCFNGSLAVPSFKLAATAIWLHLIWLGNKRVFWPRKSYFLIMIMYSWLEIKQYCNIFVHVVAKVTEERNVVSVSVPTLGHRRWLLKVTWALLFI